VGEDKVGRQVDCSKCQSIDGKQSLKGVRSS